MIEKQQKHTPKMPDHGKTPKFPGVPAQPYHKIAKPYQGMKSSVGSNSAMGSAGAITGLRVTGGY